MLVRTNEITNVFTNCGKGTVDKEFPVIKIEKQPSK